MLSYESIKADAERRPRFLSDLGLYDYEYVELDGFLFRWSASSWNPTAPVAAEPAKPRPKRIAFLGAEQTFGIYTDTPVAERVSRRHDAQCLNLGAMGAGPEFFINRPQLIEYANSCDACVIQFMDAINVSFRSYTPDAGTSHRLRESDSQDAQDAIELIKGLWEADAAGRWKMGDALRASYRQKTLELLSLIRVPKIMLWISDRTPSDFWHSGVTVTDWLSRHPFLVNVYTFNPITKAADGVASAVVKRARRTVSSDVRRQRCSGFRQTLLKDEDYPSEELYELASVEIGRALKRIGWG